MSDQSAQLKQITEHARILATDLESVRLSPGVDFHQIRVAEILLKQVVERATWAITKGEAGNVA